MMIFPLSIPAKIVFVLVCLFIGMIFSMMQWPDFWKKKFRKGNQQSKLLKALDSFSEAKERKRLRKMR